MKNDWKKECKDSWKKECKKDWKHGCMPSHKCHSGNAVYGLGFLGAAIYYLSTATTFWMGVLGILKAIVWPAFLVFRLLKMLGM